MSAREQAKEYLLWIAWTLGKYKNPLTDTEMQKMYGRSFICIAGREIEISSQRQKKKKTNPTDNLFSQPDEANQKLTFNSFSGYHNNMGHQSNIFVDAVQSLV